MSQLPPKKRLKQLEKQLEKQLVEQLTDVLAEGSSSSTRAASHPAAPAGGNTLELDLYHKTRRTEDVDAEQWRDIMEHLPKNLADKPGSFRLELRFFTDGASSVDGGASATMTMDVDITSELRQQKKVLPIYELRTNQVADNVLPEWYANAMVAVGYQWVMSKTGYQRNEQVDRGRVALKSPDTARHISTKTVLVADLPKAILETMQRILQSNESFDVNNSVSADLQFMIEPRGDWVQQPGENMCMLLAVLMSPVRASDPCTGELTVGGISVLGVDAEVCQDVHKLEGIGTNRNVGDVIEAYRSRRTEYMQSALQIYLKLWETDPDRKQPSAWVESDLEKLAELMEITIHVLMYEIGTQRTQVFGKQFCWRHVFILRKDGHYLAVRRPNVLFLNQTQSGNWNKNNVGNYFCDRCLITTCHKGANHRKKCLPRSYLEHTVEALYQRKVQSQYVNPFTEPRNSRGCNKLAYCNNCGAVKGLIKYDTDCVWTLKTEKQQEAYMQCVRRGHNVQAILYKLCANCNAEIPTPWDFRSKFQYLNEHACTCKKPELKIGDPKKYWIWDVECLQQPINGVTELPAILVCATNMADPDDKLQFMGWNCMEPFMQTLLNDPRFEGTTWIAHNGARFDVQYVCRWLNSKGLPFESVCVPGSTHAFQEVKVKGDQLRFIDSFKFIPVALGAFAKTFGLSGNFAKGDFPLRFATLEHLDYEGPMPPLDEDGADYYNLKMRGRAVDPETCRREVDAFREWHTQESQNYWTPEDPSKPRWRFWNELLKYCWQDVNVLREGCMIFRQDFMQGGNPIHGWTPLPVGPFQYMSIPQCLQAWCLAGLPDDEEIAAIPRIPKIEQRQSKKALQWLLIKQQEYRDVLKAPVFTIQHVYNSPTGREYYIGFPEKEEGQSFCALDGYACCRSRRYFFQFHGCYWHGCRQCYRDKWEELHPHRRVPYKELYRHTELLKDKIKQCYPWVEYVEIWEHDFDRELRQLELVGWLEEVTPYTQVDTDAMTDRDVFFGGRVEVFDHLCIADLGQGEEIKYIDVVSHYPNICAFHKLCTGHPKRLLGPEAFHIGKDIYNKTGQENGNVPMIAIHTTKDLRCTFNKRKPVLFYGNDRYETGYLMATPHLFPRLATVPFGYCMLEEDGNPKDSEQISRETYPTYYAHLTEQPMHY